MSEGEQGDSLFEAFLSGIHVSRALAKVSPGFPRSIETLADIVREKMSIGCDFTIEFHPREYDAKTFIGKLEDYADKADIFYDRKQRICWRRFIAAKEMAHLLFSCCGTKHLSSTPQQVEQLLVNLMAGLEKADLNDHAASTETCTVPMALEILLPHSERNAFPARITPMEIALRYRVPEQMVNLYLSEEYKNYMNTAYEAAEQ